MACDRNWLLLITTRLSLLLFHFVLVVCFGSPLEVRAFWTRVAQLLFYQFLLESDYKPYFLVRQLFAVHMFSGSCYKV